MIRALYKAAALAVAVLAPIAAARDGRGRSDGALRADEGRVREGYGARLEFSPQATYLSTIFNAGRAYSLQYPYDPAYGELATLTVRSARGCTTIR